MKCVGIVGTGKRKIRMDTIVKEIMEETCMPSAEPKGIALRIKNLSKKHVGHKNETLKDINLELESGQVVALIGSNGAGKTTLIKCIVGIYSVSSGSIEIYGEYISKHPIKAKQQLAYINDTHDIFQNMTGLEYLEFLADIYKVPKEERQYRISELSKRFNLSGHLNKIATTYSHGMKQKLCIMGALIHMPKLWVLDEPTVGLDVESTKILIDTMVEESKTALVFFSSHSMDLVAEIADKVIVLKENKIQTVLDNEGRTIKAEELEQMLKQ